MRDRSAPTPGLDLDTFFRRTITRGNVARAAYGLRILTAIFVFLLLMFSTIFIVSELFGRSSDIQKILSTTEEARIRKSENKPAENARRKTFSRTDAMEIEKTKLFGISESKTPNSAVTTSPTPPKKVEPLNLALIGIFYNKAGGSSAIIEDKKKKVQDVFREGQSVFEIATVSAIRPGQVEVKYDGGTEVLMIEDLPSDSTPAAATPSDAEEVIVQEDELNSALDNLPLLLTQARAVPYFKDGQAVGLRLFAIKSGSMFEKIGLKNGDILKNINGNNLGDFSQAMKLFEQLREERNLTLELERNRKPQTFFYKIR